MPWSRPPSPTCPDRLPDLAAALDVCAPLAVVNIEIKNWPDDKDFDPSERLAAAVVALLRPAGELDDGRNLVSCFHLPTIDRVHELAPGLATGWLLGLVEDPAPPDRRRPRPSGTWRSTRTTPSWTTSSVGEPTPPASVNAWTCDEPDRIRWLADLGVDAVITNVPDVALDALGADYTRRVSSVTMRGLGVRQVGRTPPGRCPQAPRTRGPSSRSPARAAASGALATGRQRRGRWATWPSCTEVDAGVRRPRATMVRFGPQGELGHGDTQHPAGRGSGRVASRRRRPSPLASMMRYGAPSTDLAGPARDRRWRHPPRP